MGRRWGVWLCLVIGWLTTVPAFSALSESELSHYVIPPMELGEKDPKFPVWHVLNSGGAWLDTSSNPSS